jgi:GNAT superfamily N-acetyltransferase
MERPTIVFRPLCSEDLTAIETVLRPAPFRTHADDLAWQRSGAITQIVAWRGSRPVGSGFIHWSGPRDAAIAERLPGCPEIFRLEVLQEYRSRGVGAGIVSTLEELARARGVAQLGLGVAIENARARALYERLEYALLDAPPYIDRADFPHAAERLTVEEWCVFMVKSLRRGS